MEKYSNIILSICIAILVYLFLDLFDNFRESFDQSEFKCLSNDKIIYIENIKIIKKNLTNDGYINSDNYESSKLLEIYDIILCDLKNISIENIYDIKIISHLNIPLDTNNIIELTDKIIEKCTLETEAIINKLSKVSKEETENKYLIINRQIFDNIKQEILIKVLN